MKTVLIVAMITLGPAFAHAQTLTLSSPVACKVGTDCFIQNYVDEDTTAAYRDYTCGSLSYDKHTGTDFRLPNMAAMRRGVAVIATAEGTVRGVRDNMQDVSIRATGEAAVKSRECGNGVVIDHASGFETQYCHMRSGSIAVKQGERVKAGQRLGLIGLSGATEFPHVHFEVRRLGRVLDPFTAQPIGAKCGTTGQTLWNAPTAAAFRYQSTALLGSGFHAAAPNADQVRSLATPITEVPRNAPGLFLWADIMGPRNGDTLTLTIINRNGQPLATRDLPFTRNQAQHFSFIGIKATEEGLTPGEYTGKIELKRSGKADAVIAVETKVNVPD